MVLYHRQDLLQILTEDDDKDRPYTDKGAEFGDSTCPERL